MSTTRTKKGRKPWKPARMLDVENKKEGVRYRWVDERPENVQKKEAEGWVPANSITGSKAKVSEVDSVKGGNSLSNDVAKRRDLVLMTLDEEIGQARDEYMAEKVKRQTAKPTSELRAAMKGTAGSLHGSISIDGAVEEIETD